LVVGEALLIWPLSSGLASSMSWLLALYLYFVTQFGLRASVTSTTLPQRSNFWVTIGVAAVRTIFPEAVANVPLSCTIAAESPLRW